MVWSCQCAFQSLSSNFSVWFWVVFLVRWVGSFGGVFQILGFVLVATFFARDWNLHIIDSHVVGAIVGVSWCWMLHGMCGFIWHYLLWLMVCLQSLHSVSVVTISFHQYFLLCPVMFGTFCSVSFLLCIICFFLYFFCILILHGVYVIGIVGYILVGGLILLFMYHHLCFISCCPYNMYSFIFFSSLLCFVCLFLDSHLPWFSFFPFVCFLHAWMKTFGGVCICILSYAAICGFWNMYT